MVGLAVGGAVGNAVGFVVGLAVGGAGIARTIALEASTNPNPESKSNPGCLKSIAVSSKIRYVCDGVKVGFACNIKRAMAATLGAAADVPKKSFPT
jgi:hypothetical protein